MPATTIPRRLVAASIAAMSLPRRLALATASCLLVSTLLVGTVLTGSAAAAPATADDEAIAFEERDAIPSSMISFDGTANSANARWLVDLYAQVFARPADLGGLDHWLARIAAGGEESRLVVAQSFLNSTEGARNEANLAYADLLNRQPDPEGLEFWTNFLRTGSVNTLRFQHLASDEYFAITGGTNEDYVRELYRGLLGREIDPQGYEFYLDRLETGTPRWWVSRTIYESPESLGNRVTAYYQNILERDPISSEIATGVALILAEDERAVQAALLASDEAFEVFLLAALDS